MNACGDHSNTSGLSIFGTSWSGTFGGPSDDWILCSAWKSNNQHTICWLTSGLESTEASGTYTVELKVSIILLTDYHYYYYTDLTASFPGQPIRYDTIRDAILTCARKPTWIGLIYHTETTTENCKTEKLKSKSRYVRSNRKSLGNHVVRSEKRKRKAAVGRICRKRF